MEVKCATYKLGTKIAVKKFNIKKLLKHFHLLLIARKGNFRQLTSIVKNNVIELSRLQYFFYAFCGKKNYFVKI